MEAPLDLDEKNSIDGLGTMENVFDWQNDHLTEIGNQKDVNIDSCSPRIFLTVPSKKVLPKLVGN